MKENELAKVGYGRLPGKIRFYNDYNEYVIERMAGKYYNEFYSYDDIELWYDDAWKDHGSPVMKILEVMEGACKRYRERNPLPDYYADHKDAHSDFSTRCLYLDDVVEAWREKGLVFSCSGMMRLVMAPERVVKHEKRAPRVIWVVDYLADDNPLWAMNLITWYSDLLEQCAKDEVMVQFLTFPGLGAVDPLQEKGLETQGNFQIRMDDVQMDVTMLFADGKTLADAPGIDVDTLAPVTEYQGRTLLDVSKAWQSSIGHQYMISQLYLDNMPEWNMDRHIRSTQGKWQAEGMRLEHDYSGPDDPKLLAKWEQMGLKFENHFYNQNWWVTMTPKSAFVHPEHKLPLLLIMKEPRTAIPFMMQTAMQFYYNFIDIAARGECMLLFFALETPDDNDMLVDIVKEAEKIYPIDASRIYITGQSHNGYYALEFYRRHPDLIAAAATLCDPFGLQVGAMVNYDILEEDIEASFAAHDMPLIDICGQLENQHFNTPAGAEREIPNAGQYRRRLVAFRCPECSIEDVLAARNSSDYATRMNGIPADRTEVRYMMGNECYISDVKNIDGNWHLRFVSLENMPHMIAPQMAELSWSFLRRFSRNQETGEIVELY